MHFLSTRSFVSFLKVSRYLSMAGYVSNAGYPTSNGDASPRSTIPSKSKILSNSGPFLIGVAGGTASGKTSVCEKILARLDNQPQLVIIGADSFYRELNDAEKESAIRGDFNFDHPDALDLQLMTETLDRVKQGASVRVPVYDFRNNCRKKNEWQEIPGADVVLVEGILIFYYPNIRDMFQMKLFVDTDPDTRLARRVQRDMNERGRNLEHVLHQYMTLVKPAFEEFCLPTKKYADVIIPRGSDNEVAIDLIVQHIQELLRSPRSTPQHDAQRRRPRYNSDSQMTSHRPH